MVFDTPAAITEHEAFMNRNLLVRTVVLAALASTALGAYADTKRPPPPPGSARVKVAPGPSMEEKQRLERAHHDTAGTGEVVAPPLPRGSARVRIEPGQSPEETRRILRAHRGPRKGKPKSTPSSPIGDPS
jgi:hypothetical protein